jgi:hypothetical protein
MINRRAFLRALFVAPAIVSAANIMPIFVPSPKMLVSGNINDDFKIDVYGNITYVGNSNNKGHTVLEFHRWLSNWSDDPENMFMSNPSNRLTDHMISLSDEYTIGDDTAKVLRDGTLRTKDGVYQSVTVPIRTSHSAPIIVMQS